MLANLVPLDLLLAFFSSFPGNEIPQKTFAPTTFASPSDGRSPVWFCRQRSTNSALFQLVHKVAAEFNQHKPPTVTVLIAMNFSNDFSTVKCKPHQVAENNQRFHIKTQHSRAAGGIPADADLGPADITMPCTSFCKAVCTGVPQGAAISPLVLYFFVSTHPDDKHVLLGF